MLILTRRQFERFRIGPTIITVLKAGGNVKLGIQCPNDLEVQREELEGDEFEAEAQAAGLK